MIYVFHSNAAPIGSTTVQVVVHPPEPKQAQALEVPHGASRWMFEVAPRDALLRLRRCRLPRLRGNRLLPFAFVFDQFQRQHPSKSGLLPNQTALLLLPCLDLLPAPCAPLPGARCQRCWSAAVACAVARLIARLTLAEDGDVILCHSAIVDVIQDFE